MERSSSYKEKMRKGPWSAMEDQILKDYIELNGEGNWKAVPMNAGLSRCRKSCRLRWVNYLKPDIRRGNFTEDEVDLILRLHKLLGNRWSLIAGRLPGRTDNEIKNYWNTKLSKMAISHSQPSTNSSLLPAEKMSADVHKLRLHSSTAYAKKKLLALETSQEDEGIPADVLSGISTMKANPSPRSCLFVPQPYKLPSNYRYQEPEKKLEEGCVQAKENEMELWNNVWDGFLAADLEELNSVPPVGFNQNGLWTTSGLDYNNSNRMVPDYGWNQSWMELLTDGMISEPELLSNEESPFISYASNYFS